MDPRDELASSKQGFVGGWRAFVLDDAVMVYDEREELLVEVTPEFGAYLARSALSPDQSVSAILGRSGRRRR